MSPEGTIVPGELTYAHTNKLCICFKMIAHFTIFSLWTRKWDRSDYQTTCLMISLSRNSYSWYQLLLRINLRYKRYYKPFEVSGIPFVILLSRDSWHDKRNKNEIITFSVMQQFYWETIFKKIFTFSFSLPVYAICTQSIISRKSRFRVTDLHLVTCPDS